MSECSRKSILRVWSFPNRRKQHTWHNFRLLFIEDDIERQASLPTYSSSPFSSWSTNAGTDSLPWYFPKKEREQITYLYRAICSGLTSIEDVVKRFFDGTSALRSLDRNERISRCKMSHATCWPDQLCMRIFHFQYQCHVFNSRESRRSCISRIGSEKTFQLIEIESFPLLYFWLIDKTNLSNETTSIYRKWSTRNGMNNQREIRSVQIRNKTRFPEWV